MVKLSDDDTQIFIDKIKLAAVLVQKELLMIHHVNVLKNQIKNELLDIGRVKESNEWGWAWQNISEMYDFLEFGYLDLLEEEDNKAVVAIMDKYNALEKPVEWDDLLIAYTGIRKVMERGKFHDVSRTAIKEADFLAEES